MNVIGKPSFVYLSNDFVIRSVTVLFTQKNVFLIYKTLYLANKPLLHLLDILSSN